MRLRKVTGHPPFRGDCISSEIQPIELESPRKSFFQWPTKVLGPRPGLRELNAACWTWFFALLVIQFCVPFWLRFKAGTGLIHVFPSDFIYLYGIGKIAKEYPLTSLYNYGLQLKIFTEVFPFPSHEGNYGPCPYPPFVALFFGFFARIPAVPAYFLWAFVSVGLYVAGVAAIVKCAFPRDRLSASVIFSLALSFCPFLHNTFANGQISTLAVFAVGIAILQEKNSRLFSSGLVLSILAYKPSLLFLVIPMLLLTRKFRTLCGFISGSLFLVFVATAFGGVQIWPAYAEFLKFFGRFVGFKTQSVHLLEEYIDLKSFMQAVSGGWSAGRLVLFISLSIAIASLLVVAIWKSPQGGAPAKNLAWATTLTWTLVLNVYVPVYDSILFTIAAVLTLGTLKDLKWNLALGWMASLAVFIGVFSWELETIAQSRGIQFLPILLATFGLGQVYLLDRVIRLKRSLDLTHSMVVL